MKGLIGAGAIILTFVGYVPYIKDTLKGKTKPHVYTWLVWGFVTLAAFALQVSAGGGIGSFVALTSGSLALFVAFLGFKAAKKDKSIDRINTACFLLAVAALTAWISAGQSSLAIIFVTSADMIGFVPTIRKSWDKPHQETLFLYEITTFRFALAMYALANYNFVTFLYPFTWMIANGLFSLFLIARRRQVAQQLRS
jgi:hypothetical protein